MFYLIYKITNNLNNKIYIGFHKTKNKDDGYMGSGKYLNHAYKKHGLENFTKEILFEYDNPTEMYDKEAELVNKDFLAEANTYNLKMGGFGGFEYINTYRRNIYGSNGQPGFGGENLSKGWSRVRTEEEYLKISATMKDGYASGRITPPFLGKTHTKETIDHLKGHTRQVGELNSQFGSCWMTHPTLGNKKIKKNLIESYMSLGYSKGRKFS